jgi:dephospho-CoA kinase
MKIDSRVVEAQYLQPSDLVLVHNQYFEESQGFVQSVDTTGVKVLVVFEELEGVIFAERLFSHRENLEVLNQIQIHTIDQEDIDLMDTPIYDKKTP